MRRRRWWRRAGEKGCERALAEESANRNIVQTQACHIPYFMSDPFWVKWGHAKASKEREVVRDLVAKEADPARTGAPEMSSFPPAEASYSLTTNSSPTRPPASGSTSTPQVSSYDLGTLHRSHRVLYHTPLGDALFRRAQPGPAQHSTLVNSNRPSCHRLCRYTNLSA